MSKTINLANIVPGYKSGAEEYIMENKNTSKIQVISRQDLEKIPLEPANIIIPKPFQGNIIDGYNDVAEHYLQREFPQMLAFFQNHNIPQPEITYDFDIPGESWFKVDFPIPDKILMEDGELYHYPNEKESFLFILNHYPDTPPIGFHVAKNSKNIDVLEKIFGTHMYDNAILEQDHVQTNLEQNWHWICFHYQDNEWNYNRQDIKEGDNLSYFFNYIYYRMSGVEGISCE